MNHFVGERENGLVCTSVSADGQSCSWRNLEEWELTKEEKKTQEDRKLIEQAEQLEQQRLEKRPGYKFWAFVEWWISVMMLCTAAHAMWSMSWGESVSHAYLDFAGLVVMYYMKKPIVRRTTAKESLAYQDRKAAR